MSSLLALMKSSLATIESSYAERRLTLPDLADPQPHPGDAEAATPEVRHAVGTLLGACAQLAATVAPPVETLTIMAMNMMDPACMRVALEAKVADHLDSHPEGLHISVLAEKASLDARKLARVMRVLAAKHCFQEKEADTFANNRLSALLVSSRSESAFMGHFTDEGLLSSTALLSALQPSSANLPFSIAHNTDLSFWDYLHTADPAKGERFGRAMQGAGELSVSGLLAGYPWADLPKGTTMCDLGGGVGTVSLALAARFPQLEFVLQDLPVTLEQARPLWADLADRVEFIAVDFLQESPKSGCDIYYMKWIMHDWEDNECQTILKHIASAMKPASRVLIHEYVLQSALRTGAQDLQLPSAPEPLLANYGAGKIIPLYADIHMMANVGAKERTFSEFSAMGAEAGLEFVKLYDCGTMSVLEFKLAESGKV